MKVADLQSIRIKLASPEEILSWSHGEVTKPETINYRTQRPEKNGLFCEKIFGPTKDYECYCGKYKGIRYKGIICDRCGVEVTKSQVRRERMGHIELAAPVSHIWFLRGVPSRIGLLLDVPQQKLERVVYFAGYIVEKVDEEAKKTLLKEIEQEAEEKLKKIDKEKLKVAQRKRKKEELKQRLLAVKEELNAIKPLQILSETEYQEFSLKYGEIFTAGTGAETLRRICERINLKKEIDKLKKEISKATSPTAPKNIRRLKFLQGLLRAKIRPEWMFLTRIPVLPPDLRPMVQLDGGRYASSDLNDLYRRVINRNNRLKYLLEIAAPEVIVRNEKRMLQEAVDSLLDNSMRKGQMVTATTGGKRLLKSLADILGGKEGRFRRNLLGKRVDYSGRSVITSGPELKLSECGLPKMMALELVRPFVIKKLLDRELAYNIRGASRIIDEGRPEVFAILEEIIKDKLVLLNRAPTLHRLGIQAFKPVLIEGEAIRIHPLVCEAFNADFDGDQMAVHLPLSAEAQKEAQELMLSSKNLLKPGTGVPIISPRQDIILGCYYLTGQKEGDKEEVKGWGKVFGSFEEVILAEQLGKLDLRAKIKVSLPKGFKGKKKEGFLETTCGRIIFNDCLPENFPFVNTQINAKKLSRIIAQIISEYPREVVEEVLDKIKEVGFEYSTLSGLSWGMEDLIVPPQKKELLQEAEKEIDFVENHFKKGLLSPKEKAAKVIEIWQGVKEKIEKLVSQTLPKDGPVYSIVDSGARGSWAQPVQMAGMKGLVTSPAGQTIELPIKNSFKEGFDVLEYFISTHGARKGTADTALRTSKSGYLTRRLIDVAHEVIVTSEDCGDKEGREIFREDATELGQNFIFKIVGRVALENVKSEKGEKIIVKKGEIIDWEKAREIDKAKIKKVKVRSPLSCKSQRGVCQKCYGWEMGRNEMVKIGEAVGVIAAQSIGEPGTQLTMRTFHLGGVAGGGDITRGLPRIEEIFELREPKIEAPLVQTEGFVSKIDLEKRKIFISSKVKSNPKRASRSTQILEYNIPPETEVFVKKGEKIMPGQPLCSGSLNLKKLFKLLGEAATQRYIIKEIQRIYTGEGIDIHDKHLEIITRQMFSRVMITDGGDGPLVRGEIVPLAEVKELNSLLKKEGKKEIKFQQILLGISRVALSSDSFLSAASFQETSRVLIRAALEGKEDKLRGLKENVIIGRLIPAGTGFRK
ncbi:DNA-directed RNA polymerase subunit beta' [bacterium]|nr:DNA-directed RNA polymerase subunit beta' [bacterium]